MCFTGGLPDHFKLIPEKPIIVLQGGTGQVICEAEGASVITLQWRKFDQPVPNSMVTKEDIGINLVRATLRITNAQSGDTGDYECVLTAFGKSSQKRISIRVDGKFVTAHHVHQEHVVCFF